MQASMIPAQLVGSAQAGTVCSYTGTHLDALLGDHSLMHGCDVGREIGVVLGRGL
jgi:hypothetical protein